MTTKISLALALAALGLATAPAARADITLYGVGSIPASATDLSGLTGSYHATDGSGDSPKNRLGAFGSGIAYTGQGTLYYAVNDRGFGNGTTDYADRFQTFDLKLGPNGHVAPTLKATTFLTNEQGTILTGLSSAFTGSDATKNLRFDPEGIRVAPDGTFYVSDEYGPVIYHFDKTGKRIGTINLPAKLQVANPNADGDTETNNNTVGRVANKGMEGLAISPDGSTLFGIMQSPLIQDGGKKGVDLRIVKVDLTTGKTNEYVYQLNDKSLGVSEIVAINDHQFLVDERDGKGGDTAAVKDLYQIDLTGATDVSAIGTTKSNGLPKSGLPNGVTAVSKSLFLDLLDPKFGLNANHDFPEKIEGLAFGPDFANGDHLLIVTNDNDLLASNPNNFYAFRIGANDLPGYQAQRFAATPEPGSLVVFALGALPLAALAIRRRAR